MKTWKDGWVNRDGKAEKGNSWTELPWTEQSDTHVDWVDTHVDWVDFPPLPECPCPYFL